MAQPKTLNWAWCLLLLMVSTVGGLISWNRPVKPLWVAHEGQGLSLIYGSSPDGEIACLESSTRVAVRDLRTGAILRAFDIPPVETRYSVMTEDGEWILLLSKKQELLVVSARVGRLRYPPIPIQSDDGRYAIMHSTGQLPTEVNDELIDLHHGKELWSMTSRVRICGCYQDLVIASDPPSFLRPRLITISDQRDLGPISIPEMSGREFVAIGPYVDDRILLAYRIPMAGGNPDNKYLSARISDGQLVDIRDEPNLFTRMTSPDRYVISFPKGQRLIQDLHKSQTGNFMLAMYRLGSRWGLIRGRDSTRYFWQNTTSGRPVGPPIPLESGMAWPTKDGRYLVESGERLAVFAIPPHSRWPETTAVVALPWLLMVVWRRFRARRGRSPSLAGSQPVQ